MIYFNNVKMTRKNIETYKDGKELKKQDIGYQENIKVSFELEEQF